MSTSNAEKVKAGELPFNLDLERGLLGAILIDNRALERIPEKFGEGHFHDPGHGELYAAIRETITNHRLASAVTLKNAFNGTHIGGLPAAQYLDLLVASATTIFNAPEYARTLLELSQRRSLIAAAQDMIGACQRGAVERPVAKVIESFEQTLLKVSVGSPTGDDEVSFERALELAIARANEAFQRKGGIVGLSTGLVDLDAKLGGMAPTDLIILGGRPAMGKTALATNIAFYNASQFLLTGGGKGCPVHFFSQEMSAEQLATRILSERTDLPSDKVRRGLIEMRDFTKLIEAQRLYEKAPLIVDQTGGLSIAQLTSRARRVKRKNDTGLIVVDYLQLMHGASKENRNQDLTQITNGLKALAKELGIPILVLSQLSRGVESREDKRPHLADLRESGSIEQDADVVLFVYREEYYLALREPDASDMSTEALDKHRKWETRMAASSGKGEVILGKHRHGEIGIVELQFNSKFTRFSCLAKPGIPEGVHP